MVTQSLISYPETGINGNNILFLSKTTFNSDSAYSLAAELAKGTALKIKITSLSADTTTTLPSDTSDVLMNVNKAGWYYSPSSGINWSISDFDLTNFAQTFTAIESDKSCDLRMYFDKGSFLIEYFEMNSTDPTREKTITCN